MSTIDFEIAVNELISNIQFPAEKGNNWCFLTMLKNIWARINRFFAPNLYSSLSSTIESLENTYTFADCIVTVKERHKHVTLYSANMYVTYIFWNGALVPQEKYELDTKSRLSINTAVPKSSIIRPYSFFKNTDLKLLLNEHMFINHNTNINSWGVTRTLDDFANIDLCEIVQKIKRRKFGAPVYSINFNCKFYIKEKHLTFIHVTIHHEVYLNNQSNFSIERIDGEEITYSCFDKTIGNNEVIDAIMPIIKLMI